MRLAIKVAYIGYLVKDRPSLNCLKAWKIIKGTNEIAMMSKYGSARTTTSLGWFIKYRSGLANNINTKSSNDITEHRTSPCLKVDFPFIKFCSESDSANSGVMAVEKPIPKAMATKKKLLPKETAASSADPKRPTMILSTKPTRT